MMTTTAAEILSRLTAAAEEEQALFLRFFLGKRTAQAGAANPALDLFLGTLAIELPGAVELLQDLRFRLGASLEDDLVRWGQSRLTTAELYPRLVARCRELLQP